MLLSVPLILAGLATLAFAFVRQPVANNG